MLAREELSIAAIVAVDREIDDTGEGVGRDTGAAIGNIDAGQIRTVGKRRTADLGHTFRQLHTPCGDACEGFCLNSFQGCGQLEIEFGQRVGEQSKVIGKGDSKKNLLK